MRRSLLVLAALVASACSSEGHLVVRVVSRAGGGAAVEGARVQVNDGAWVTTSANGEAFFDRTSGAFTVRAHHSYAVPSGLRYDSLAELRGRTGNEVVVEVDPVAFNPTAWHQAEISGSVVRLAGASQSTLHLTGPGTVGTLGPDGAFDSWLVGWRGGATGTVTLQAIETDAAIPPGHYYGYGSQAVTVSDGGTITGVSLRLAPVTEGQVAGTVSVPAALSSADLFAGVSLTFSGREGLGVTGFQLDPGSFALTVPRVGGATPSIDLIARGPPPAAGLSGAGAWHFRDVAVPSSGLSFDLPAPVDSVEPAADAPFGPSTPFRWSGGPTGGIHTLSLACTSYLDGVARDVRYEVVEPTQSQVTLPAIAELALESGATCSWAVLWCAATDSPGDRRCSTSSGRRVTVP